MTDQLTAFETVMIRIASHDTKEAMFFNGKAYTYNDLLEMIQVWEKRIVDEHKLKAGSVVSVLGEFSPQICALFFALMKQKMVLVPLTYAITPEIDELEEIAQVDVRYTFDEETLTVWTLKEIGHKENNELVAKFLKRKSAGLIVFSSGSTGKKKGILHDCENVMKKFVEPRKPWRTVLFLMMDHFGGFNTFIGAFAHGGTAVAIPSRDPSSICKAIQESKATLLPTTPTFLNFLLTSKVFINYDLSSIELITYGTEVMSETTLAKIKEVFPSSRIKQTYGLSEVGVVKSRSKGDSSLMLKIGGSGFDVKVIDNILWIKSEANMVGYLNAPNPINEDGWMSTGDQVEVEGEYLRIIGRKSDMINVGGQKVFPVEVEDVLLKADNVKEATVYGTKHPLMGNVVHSRVILIEDEDRSIARERLRKHCMIHLAKFKVPVKIIIEKKSGFHNERFKKIRRFENEETKNS